MQIYYEDEQGSLFAPDCSAGKTCREPFPVGSHKAKIFASSLKRRLESAFPAYMFLDLSSDGSNLLGGYEWEIRSPWDGGCWMLNTGESPSAAAESSLSQILQDSVPPKYYLSQNACRGILRRAAKRGKALPGKLKQALEIQAGQATEAEARNIAKLDAGVGQPILVAGFSAGAGASAGGIGYSEKAAPTLKASASGNSMPSVLCLCDQGGKAISCAENLSGTLRAQEHGHQPLVYENHGIDGRYTGPHEVAPTMSARYGTGGNNVPLVEQAHANCISGNTADCHTVFSRQRVDVFRDDDVVSTQSARQHKDATDLILEPSGTGGNIYTKLIRRLTPLECERLQGFPDGWTELPGASDAARYKALGNSVAIPCVSFLMKGMAEVLRDMYK